MQSRAENRRMDTGMMNEVQDTVMATIVGVVEQEVKAGAHPISDDLQAFVRTLTAATAMTLSADSAIVACGGGRGRAVRITERLWLTAL
jgi:hypothetical protein